MKTRRTVWQCTNTKCRTRNSGYVCGGCGAPAHHGDWRDSALGYLAACGAEAMLVWDLAPKRLKDKFVRETNIDCYGGRVAMFKLWVVGKLDAEKFRSPRGRQAGKGNP